MHTDPEQRKAYNIAYRAANKEKIKAQRKKFRDLNKEKLKQLSKEYYIANKKSLLENASNYYENNKEECKRKSKAYKIKTRGIKPSMCPSYNITLAERNKEDWLYEDLTVYKLKLTGDNEVFFKYGLTINIKDRIARFPYRVEIIQTLTLDKYEAVYFEQSLLKDKVLYKPKKKFHGYTECFK